jgi:serine/threonine-protein kinase
MEMVGKYEIRERVGAGGFGVVYRAWDPGIGREVALKTLVTDDPGLRERFVREARLAGNLQHPNITTIYDFGVDNGTPYLAQEYLSGEDLAAKIKRRDPLPLSVKLRHLVDVASGLAAAHDQRVVHRDIKPANIRILANGTAKIMDFGIAKRLDQETDLTRTGFTIGTTAYLSPEQVTGVAVDHRCDIFSFGLVMYELLTYARAIPGPTISDAIRQVTTEPHVAISLHWPTCPPALVAIVDRCLAKQPAARFADCHELRAAIEAARQAVADVTFPTDRATDATELRPATAVTDVTATRTEPLSRGPGTAEQSRLAAAATLTAADAERTVTLPVTADSRPTLTRPADDLAVAQQALLSPPLSLPNPRVPPRQASWRRPLVLLGLALVAGLAAVLWLGRSRGDVAPGAASAPALAVAATPGSGRPAPPPLTSATAAAAPVAEEPVAPPLSAPAPTVVAPAGQPPAAEDAAAAHGQPDVPRPLQSPATGATPAPAMPPSDAAVAVAPAATATLELAPPWTDLMTVRLDGGPPRPVATTGRLAVAPGPHRLVFELPAELSYPAREEVTVDLAAGAVRHVGSTIARPGLLGLQALPGTPQGTVRLNGRVAGDTPLGRWLAPGRYELAIGDGRHGVSATVEMTSGELVVATFDLSRDEPPQLARRPLEAGDPSWDEPGDEVQVTVVDPP